MDLQYLRRLLKIFDESTVVDLRIEEEGMKLRMSKTPVSSGTSHFAPPHLIQMQGASAPAPAPVVSAPSSDAPKPKETSSASDSKNLYEITSPIVGTFYRAPAPDAESFVQVGSTISPGTTLCIVEAMKLMNEIESDVAGVVVKALVENGQPVEYGQPLFLIDRQ